MRILASTSLPHPLPSARRMVVHQIMEAAIVREDLAAANWTISLVNTRLFLARRLHNMVA